MSVTRDKAFWDYVNDRYKGKVYRIEKSSDPMYDRLIVRVEFHLPSDVDEIEVYRRINQVIEVIVDGEAN